MAAQPDILDLTDDVAARTASTPVAPSVVPVEPQPASHAPVVRDNLENDPSEPPVPRSVEEARRQFAQAAADEGPLLSSATSTAVDTAFNTLTHAVLVQNSRTIDDVVKEALRPMLKTWLDDNLPAIVERLVRAEIERVSRGRG